MLCMSEGKTGTDIVIVYSTPYNEVFEWKLHSWKVYENKIIEITAF